VMGIEPTWPAWKAGALPLSYTRFNGLTNYSRCECLVLDRMVTQSADLFKEFPGIRI
jgi:hypothetical protein